jgi:hypothetical protein
MQLSHQLTNLYFLLELYTIKMYFILKLDASLVKFKKAISLFPRKKVNLKRNANQQIFSENRKDSQIPKWQI